ncbi:hypothetical protein A3D77_04000 [Candidatus Gottesmanbacteria bacterium RIFCSPHIGHO2_02_FULL_39_11]|uniref:Uncharacterized protein n=1 Tax=Candidatus Gottesmanbacteria bacterium RIFCSPHIGHO2_02_FULL_39_11 TaxID=1798382 RepID=A0A1F5ZKM2_9BACT|nr:MAG: hypothetical protein A3D77_04000 [Candidatus Gottesmanbacteria bacterium RIFCSPHIGHO2_02_FULL_39_11]
MEKIKKIPERLTEIIKDRNNIFIIIWSLLPFFLIPFATGVGLSKIRLYAMMSFIPLSLIFCLVVFPAFQKKIARMLIFFVIILNFSTSVSLLIQNTKIIDNQPLYSNIYYPNKQWEAINFLKDEAPDESIILSDEHIGNIIPAFIPVTSYFGHINLTVHFKEKQNNVWRFYTRRMNEEEVKRFISDNRISYVWFGTDEKALENENFSYPFLKIIYQEGQITIYKVI